MKLRFIFRVSLRLCALFAITVSAAEKPNILVIVSDDQGYADAGFQGSKQAVTPHLDALAKSGVRCTSGYVTFPVCSASRAGFLTGRYQARFGHENNPVYDPLDEKEGLPLTEKLLPQYFKEAGYSTGWFGKWHLGAAPSFAPWKRGFDASFGFIGGGHRFIGWQPNERQYTLPLIRSGENIADVPAHLTTALGEQAAGFIRSNKDKPWMIYLPFNAPHTPHEPTAERLEKFSHIQNPQRSKYLAQLSLLDDAIGAVTTALSETAQRERTLIFFFSDNGGPAGGPDNTPLRGTKGTLYEGGVRVPFLISWPAKLPAGVDYEQPVSSVDILATTLAAAGIAMPTDKKYDSVNLLPHLANEVKTPPHERLLWRMNGKQSFAVREGNWKLMSTGTTPPVLYDLAADIAESKDIAAEKPEVASRLTAALEAWKKELIAPVFPGSSVKNEDWGPGGANQKNAPQNKPTKP
jgi:arylsulfatase A-like enzyme